jgi:hypothetical protein
VSQPTEEPIVVDDPDDGWPVAHLGSGHTEDRDDRPHRPAHLRAVIVAAVAVVVVGLVVGIFVFNASAPPLGRGASSASDAAATFVAAIDNGDEKAAADISCDQFADAARAAARTGSDPGITFALGRLTMRSTTTAAVSVQERITLPGGTLHRQPLTLDLQRSGGRWLVCGRSG